MEECGFGCGSSFTTRQAERTVPEGIKVLPFTREPVGPKNWSFLSVPSIGSGHRFWPKGTGKPHWRKLKLRAEEVAAGEASQAVSLFGPLSPSEIFSPTESMKRMFCYLCNVVVIFFFLIQVFL